MRFSIFFLALSLCACASQPTGAGCDNSQVAFPPVWSLPAPSQLAASGKLPAYTAADQYREGEAFNFSLPHQRAHANGTATIFTPAWDGVENTGFTTLSYVFFDFSIPAYDGEHVLQYHWNTAPAQPTQVYFGLSNWQDDRWDWYAGTPGGQVPYSSNGPYFNESGRMLVCVLQYLTDTNKLDWIAVGTPQ